MGESYRGRRKDANRRDTVDDKLDELKSQVQALSFVWVHIESCSVKLSERLGNDWKRTASLLRSGCSIALSKTQSARD